jgi:hypothetical protein
MAGRGIGGEASKLLFDVLLGAGLTVFNSMNKQLHSLAALSLLFALILVFLFSYSV